ncbi:MAG: VWA domain-containing protein [Chitinophagaceae bacterium]|jgi:Ca-activated chloride channel family protein|nr:VWA domain-containing protein [Chitinophagaceae bacterium]
MQAISFQYPDYIWLLAILLPLAGLWWWQQYRVRLAMAAWLRQRAAVAGRVPGYKPARNYLSAALFLGAMLLLLLAAMLPQKPQQQAVVPRRGLQVMLLADISNSMLAADLPPSRLERMRSFALKLVNQLEGNTIGLTVFAGDAWLQMPPTTDYSAIKQALQTLDPDQMPAQGTKLKPALETAIKALQSRQGQANAVVLLTDGEEPEDDVMESVEAWQSQGLVIHAVGFGTPEGSTISLLPNAAPLTDEAGNTVITKLYDAKLKALTDATNGDYYTLEAAEANTGNLIAKLQKLPQQPLPNQKLINYYPYSPWLIAIALVMLLGHLAMALQVKLPPIFLGKKVVGVLLLTVAGSVVYAQNTTALMKKANEAYKAGNFAIAEATYREVLQLDPANYLANFNLANLQLKKDANSEAAKLLKPLITKPNGPKQQVATLNNAGLAAARQNELDEAIAYLKKALARQPADEVVRQNLQKALMDKQASKQNQQKPPPPASPPPPRMDDEKAKQQLESIMEEERKLRKQMKPGKQGAGATKNW